MILDQNESFLFWFVADYIHYRLSVQISLEYIFKCLIFPNVASYIPCKSGSVDVISLYGML